MERIMNGKRIQQSISLGALLLALVHLIWPSLSIDWITVALLVLALLPWLGPVFKSFELPGGFKVEFQQLKEAAERADAAGLLRTGRGDAQEAYSFQAVALRDPNLALAGLRIEIEKRLIQLAEAKGIGTRMQGMGRLMQELHKVDVLTNEQVIVMGDMLALLNEAVHGGKVDPRASEWALEIGPQLIESLEARLETVV